MYLNYLKNIYLNFYQYMYIFYWLYVIEYCSFNSQADITDDSLTGFKQGGLGSSITTLKSAQWGSFNDYRPLCPNGYFKDCGNHTAFKTFDIDINGSKITLQTHSWHGFQNIFGDIFMNLDGVTIIKKQENGVWKTIWELIKNPQNYTDSESTKSDTVKIEIAGIDSLWPSQMYFGDEGLIISDDILMAALSENDFPPQKAVVMAIEAGVDCIMISQKRFASSAKILYDKAQKDSDFLALLQKASFRVIKYKVNNGLVKL